MNIITKNGKNNNTLFLGENMKLKRMNNIIFLKNMESNIMEEAVIVLKDNSAKNYFKNDTFKNRNDEKNIIKEAELIVNQKIEKAIIEQEKLKIGRIKKKYKILKFLNIILILILLFLIF